MLVAKIAAGIVMMLSATIAGPRYSAVTIYDAHAQCVIEYVGHAQQTEHGIELLDATLTHTRYYYENEE